VLALNAMATLLGENLSVFHAIGSKAFTENLRKVLGPGARPLFKYFNQFTSAGKGEIDVLVCDEAHRIRESSNNRYTPSFCWRWSDPDKDGRLPDDVVIGDYRRPWNAKPDGKRLARGIPKSNFWAFESRRLRMTSASDTRKAAVNLRQTRYGTMGTAALPLH
jgi:hypothetical protein